MNGTIEITLERIQRDIATSKNAANLPYVCHGTKQVLAWARRVKAQGAHKALIAATKDKGFDTINRHKQKNNTPDRAKPC